MPALSLSRRHVLAAAGACAAGGRAWAQAVRTRVRLETGQGVILVELADDRAPITTANFLHYVDSGRMDLAVFYRASRTPGAPTMGLVEAGLRIGGKTFPPVAHEPTTQTGLKHLDGTLSMARFAPGSATSDFSICCGDAPYLDADPNAPGDNLGYAAFGQVVDGMATARAILALPTTGVADNPAMQGQILDPPVKILSARRV